MTEVEKMRNGLLADMSSPELQVRFEHAKKLLARMRGMSTYDEGYRKLLEELVPRIPETSVICPPFYCDHGRRIYHDWCSYAYRALCADLHTASSDGLFGKKRLQGIRLSGGGW